MSLYSSKSNKSKDDFITSLITCKICNKIYEDPVILPCHKTICSKHVIDQTNCSIYRCNFCKNFHIIDLKKWQKLDFIINYFLKYKHIFLFL